MVSNFKYHQGKFEQLAAIVQMLLFLSLVISAALIPKPIISPQADDNGRRANHELAVHRCRWWHSIKVSLDEKQFEGNSHPPHHRKSKFQPSW
jgi:hypothetical protein